MFTSSELRRSLRRAGARWLSWSGVTFSLGFKLLVPVILVTIAVAGTAGLTVTNDIRTELDHAYTHEQEDAAAGAEAMYQEDPSDISRLNDLLARIDQADPEITHIRIVGLDASSTVIASSQAGEVGTTGLLTPDQQKVVLRGEQFHVQLDSTSKVGVFPLTQNGRVDGAVMVTVSTAAETASIRSVTQTIGIAAALSALIVSAVLLAVFYANILRRTRHMQAAIEAVGRGDYSHRIPEGQEPPGRDEIFNLARSVDLMISRLDERSRGEALIRHLGRKALEGVASPNFVADTIAATKDALGLESCIFATVTEAGVLTSWTDHNNVKREGGVLPIWVSSLTRVALEARRAIVTDRLGQQGRFVDDLGMSKAQAVVVPLPRMTKAGHVIVATAPAGGVIQEGGLAVLDAVAATIAETLHMQAAEEARAESAVKSKVMAAVSHEMRNPLNSVLGFTGLLMNGANTNLTDKQRRQLANIQSSASLMLALVNNYLDLARVRSGSVTLQPQKVRLAQIVTEVETAMQPAAQAKPVEVRCSVQDVDVTLDAVRLRQILTNLLSNAVKFTPPGGHVYVRARLNGDICRIAVSDTGVGIAKAQRQQVFTEFAKIDAGAMAAGKGSGLGLALTRAFVGAMGGQIRFHSRPGRGTTFVVTLPSGTGATAKAA